MAWVGNSVQGSGAATWAMIKETPVMFPLRIAKTLNPSIAKFAKVG